MALSKHWKIVSLFLLLAACAGLLWRPIFHAGLGAAAKVLLSLKTDWKLSFNSLEWKENQIVIAHAVLFDAGEEGSSFHAQIEKVSIQFNWKEFPKKLKGHVTVDRPRVNMDRLKPLKWGSGWFEWTLAVREGTAVLAGIEPVGFSFEKTALNQLGRLKLDWPDSSLFLEGREEGNESKFDLDLKNFPGNLTQSLISFLSPSPSQVKTGTKIGNGIFEGNVHVALEKGKFKRCAAHLAMRKVSFFLPSCEGKELDGVFDWEGTFEPKKGLLGDAMPFSWNGKMRGSVSHLELKTQLGSLENLAGEFTYNSGMGAKWEIKGNTPDLKVEWKGRAFLHSQAVNWIESDAKLGSCSVFLKAKEEEKGRIWSVGLDSFSVEQAEFFQWVAAAFSPETSSFFPWKLTQGVLGGEGRVVFSDRGIEDWAISRFKMDGVEIRKKDFRFSLQTGEGKFSLQGSEGTLAGGEFEFPKFGFQGKDWEGQWRWEKGALTPSHFNGWIDALDHRGARIQTGVKAQGSWERLAIECDLAGFLTGQLAASGGWEKDKWQFKIDQGEIEGVSFKGKGWIDQGGGFSLSVPEFSGSLGWLGKVWEGNFDGRIRSIGEGLELGWQEGLWDWSLQAKVEQAQFDSSLNGFSIGRLEQGSLELFTSPTEWSCYGIEGDWVRPEGKVHFFSPALIGKGDCWAFDFRCDSEISRSWDLFRFVGTAQGEKIVLDAAKSHLFGSSLKRAECAFDVKEGLKTLDLETVFPWSAILSAGPFLETYFKGWARPSLEAPLSGSAKVHFHYSKDGGSEGSIQGIDLLWKGDPLAADFHALELKKGKWKIDRFLLADINLNCSVQKGPEGYRIESGSGRWGRSTEALFEGTISPEFHSNLILKSAKVNLSEISSLTSLFGSSLSKIEGILEGEGHLSYEKIFEADFDFIPSHLKAGSLPLENRGPFHLYFSSEKGVFFQGLDLHVLKPDQELEWDLPWIDCKVGMLQYDSVRSHWVLNHSLIRLPSELFANLQKRPALFRLFDENEDLQFIADLDFASDFSNLACSMKEGWIPFGGAVRHLKDLQFQLNETDCKGTFKTEHNGHLLSLSFDVDMDAKIGGTLILEEVGAILEQGERPLKIDWEYAESSGGILHSIEGSFPGLDASFHSELSTGANTLIGTARIDFKTLSEFLPSKICEVFQELHMGKGYELKGRLKLENKQAFFQGLLYGKQYELFSYQFRTLLGQIDVRPDQVRIYDLKLSDSAGKMKIDEILMKEEKAGWTLSIPNLSIFELRPSLLQKPGQELGKLSPLLVRELKITDFKGMLDDSKTYTAKGHLHFINSFKREPTVFDLPADVLSRIVGLDLELLIPVSGSLEFELKDRFFRLMELKEAFSQSHRSEFFLEKGEDPQEPFMDLDGNLKILIKMKQFVLFKFTEAFLISIDGSLSDPQFHLQKKRRFFGL